MLVRLRELIMSVDEVVVYLQSIQVLDGGLSVFAIRAESPAALKILMPPYIWIAVAPRKHSDCHEEHDYRKYSSPIHLLSPAISIPLNYSQPTSHYQTLLTAIPANATGTHVPNQVVLSRSFETPQSGIKRGSAGRSCAVNASLRAFAGEMPSFESIGVVTRTSAPSVRFSSIASVTI